MPLHQIKPDAEDDNNNCNLDQQLFIQIPRQWLQNQNGLWNHSRRVNIQCGSPHPFTARSLARSLIPWTAFLPSLPPSLSVRHSFIPLSKSFKLLALLLFVKTLLKQNIHAKAYRRAHSSQELHWGQQRWLTAFGWDVAAVVDTQSGWMDGCLGFGSTFHSWCWGLVLLLLIASCT